MPSLSVKIDVLKVEGLASNLRRITPGRLGSAAMRGLNRAAEYTFEESRRRILSGVNLTDAYVKSRMDLEPANDPNRPSATIVAFRKGGRRPATEGVNLRQYAAVQLTAPVRFNNSDPRIAGNKWGRNPRAADKFLKWKKRTGHPALGIPVGEKQAGVSVEVKQGSRKTLRNAFIQRMRNGQALVMERINPNARGKGKIRALASLSVWQMFRKQMAVVVPLAEKRMRSEIADEVLAEINEVLK